MSKYKTQSGYSLDHKGQASEEQKYTNGSAPMAEVMQSSKCYLMQ